MKLNEDKILVEPVTEKTVGGIVIPGIGNMGYMECKVLGVGPGRYNPYADKVVPHGIAVGDRVLINQGVIAKLPITKAGKKVKWSIVPASECIGPLEDDETI